MKYQCTILWVRFGSMVVWQCTVWCRPVWQPWPGVSWSLGSYISAMVIWNRCSIKGNRNYTWLQAISNLSTAMSPLQVAMWFPLVPSLTATQNCRLVLPEVLCCCHWSSNNHVISRVSYIEIVPAHLWNSFSECLQDSVHIKWKSLISELLGTLKIKHKIEIKKQQRSYHVTENIILVPSTLGSGSCTQRESHFSKQL